MKKLMLVLLLSISGLHAYGAVTSADCDVNPVLKKEPVMDGGSGGGPIIGPDGKPLKNPKGGK